MCNGDVRAAAADLDALGCDVDLRIIGFDLTEEAISSFTNIGTFENARDAKQLAAALDRAVVDEVEREPLGDAQLQAPDEVVAGSKFQVSWQAEEGDGDYITIVSQGAPAGFYTHYQYTRTGPTVTIRAPGEPGIYEIRYQSDRNREDYPSRTVNVH